MFSSTIGKVLDYKQDTYDLEAVVFTQGFDYEGQDSRVTYIRDDSYYRKGKSISEIREYFTLRATEEFGFDYILFTDDDFKFRDLSGESLYNNVMFMENHQNVGLINMKMTNKPCSDEKDFSPINPTFVYMRGGILVRVSAYNGWGGKFKCIYYEEAVLATLIYAAGYDVYQSSTDVIHRTAHTGLGRTIEREHKEDFSTINGGRQVLARAGYVVPQTDENGLLNYRVPCKLSDYCENLHLKGLTLRS